MQECKPVTVVEVGPRDGLQNEHGRISTEDKLRLIHLLSEAGLNRIEVTAFVSPKWVPQMADHTAVMLKSTRRKGLVLSALVPNEKGGRAALEAGAQELAVFASASETFAQKNTNCSIAESIERFKPVLQLASERGIAVRGYVSCAVDCPYEGAIAPEAVARVSADLLSIGCHEIAVSDTIGRATPDRVDAMLSVVTDKIEPGRLACHFHDTAGQALANIDVSLRYGITVFDSSAGGLGGCPYAPGAAGNVATELVVRHLHSSGYVTGINSEKLAMAAAFARTLKRGGGYAR